VLSCRTSSSSSNLHKHSRASQFDLGRTSFHKLSTVFGHHLHLPKAPLQEGKKLKKVEHSSSQMDPHLHLGPIRKNGSFQFSFLRVVAPTSFSFQAWEVGTFDFVLSLFFGEACQAYRSSGELSTSLGRRFADSFGTSQGLKEEKEAEFF